MVTFIIVCLFLVISITAFILYIEKGKDKTEDDILKEKKVDELCTTEAEFELKEKFQALAGIKGNTTHNFSDAQIEGFKQLADNWSKVGFPEPDKNHPVTTAKLATIETKFEDYDPLFTIPLSKVSIKAKQKMAEIAKEDIRQQIQKQASIFPESVEYTDEYFKQYTKNQPSDNDQRLGVEYKKPAKKKSKNPKK